MGLTIEYHKGAQGLFSSRKGYGHLQEVQNMLMCLHVKWKI